MGEPGACGATRVGVLLGMALSLEPGTMPFIQLGHEDLLAGLGRVAVFPVGGPDLMGFRVSVPGAFLTFGSPPTGGSGYLSGALSLQTAPLLPWSYSSGEPWPHARGRSSFCKVC